MDRDYNEIATFNLHTGDIETLVFDISSLNFVVSFCFDGRDLIYVVDEYGEFMRLSISKRTKEAIGFPITAFYNNAKYPMLYINNLIYFFGGKKHGDYIYSIETNKWKKSKFYHYETDYNSAMSVATFGHCIIELAPNTDDVYILKLNDNENRFNNKNIKNIHDALDFIEKQENASCLITTGTNPKYFSNGLDLEWAMTIGMEGFQPFIKDFQCLLARFLTFPMPTIAALNGHTFAGGAMLACSHDYRIMRNDKGFFCLPEVDIHIPLTPGMNAVLQAKITDASTYRDTVLLGKRFSGEEASKLRIVDKATTEEMLLPEAIQLATKIAPKGKDRFTFGALKRELYRSAMDKLKTGDFGESSKLQLPFAKL
ncbi:hypothetical protein PPL_02869 [Heterostelium album PN500]|uniref:Enoyl-CoA hydratase n=1 Tax=Heterostelium pallidum (strain ATCC 26659 / Pp 5 / PN500) TaxID=670386 RepID=D3B3A3_HETP5|nr:hypothetical protein PPL_02869 [Heterostelium album PN500]EFA83801.1 hypothetical protein PPL_02869 [Heterostelium album PN500]|eukprot:XP_020435918.1 hypothetical protein PPL_02869 [Heterostelium album PN500]